MTTTPLECPYCAAAPGLPCVLHDPDRAWMTRSAVPPATTAQRLLDAAFGTRGDLGEVSAAIDREVRRARVAELRAAEQPLAGLLASGGIHLCGRRW